MAKSATNKLKFSLYKLHIDLRAIEGQEFKFGQRKNIFNGNDMYECLKLRLKTKVVIYKIERVLKQI